MLWSNEDIAKLREMIVKHPIRSVVQLTLAMGYGYNVDDVSGVCAAILTDKGDNNMSANRIDPVEFWKMVDAGTPTRDIAKYFGVAQTSVCHKIAKGRPKAAVLNPDNKDKEIIDMKWTAEKTEQLLRMKDEDLTAEEIADALGCGKQAVFDKLKNLKKLNGGVLPTAHKRKYTVADVTPYKPENVDDLEETPADEPTETPPERPCKVDFDVILDSADAGKPKPVETVTDAVKTGPGAVRESKAIDIVALAYKAKWLATDLGFTPDHLLVDCFAVRDDIIVSGKDANGKVYEIRCSVTDPSKFTR